MHIRERLLAAGWTLEQVVKGHRYLIWVRRGARRIVQEWPTGLIWLSGNQHDLPQ